MQDVIPSVQRLPNAFADDRRARPELLAQHAEAAQFGLRRQLPEDACDRRSVPIHVLSTAGNTGQLQPIVHNGQIVSQAQPLECRVISLNAGIEHGNADAAPAAFAQVLSSLFDREPGIQL